MTHLTLEHREVIEDALKEKMTDVTVRSRAGMDFYDGKLCGTDAVVVRCGIGKVNAAFGTNILASDFTSAVQKMRDEHIEPEPPPEETEPPDTNETEVTTAQ